MTEAEPKTRATELLLLGVTAAGGFAVMGFEMALARQAAPHLGASMPVWAALISWVLLTMAVGYAAGGRASLRWPSLRLLAVCFAGACLLFAITALAGPTLLHAMGGLLRGEGSLVAVVAGVAVAVLSGAPLILLGAVLPISVRIGVSEAERSGAVAGRLYAASTIGSLAGTLLPAFVLIPLWGTRWTLVALALVCAGVAAACAGRLWLAAVALPLVFAGGVGESFEPGGRGRVILSRETPYYNVTVSERPDGQRELRLGAGRSVQSVYHPNGPSSRGTWPAFVLGQELRRDCQEPPHRLLILGLAAGTAARDFGLAFPGIEVQGVEIDGALIELGREYFGMPASTRAEQMDARLFLEGAKGSYDLIVANTYRDLYVPFHLTTQEFFRLAAERLEPGGVIVVNVLAWPGEDSLARAMAQTMGTVFDRVAYLAQPNLANVIIYAWNGAPLVKGRGCLLPAHPLQAELVTQWRDRLRPWQGQDGVVLTDDHAPVELLTHRIAAAVLSGRGRWADTDRVLQP